MTDFDDIADLWRKQTVDPDVTRRAGALEQALREQSTQRRRAYAWGAIIAVSTLVLMQAVGFANAASFETSLLDVRFAAHQLTYLGILAYLLRRMHGLNLLDRHSSGAVRENLTIGLRVVESEMRDLRTLAWLGPWLLLAPLFVPDGSTDFAADFLGSATSVLMFTLVVGKIAWHHYRTTLTVRRRELQGLLAELPRA